MGGLLSVLDAASGASHYPTYDGNGNVSEYIDQTGAEAAHFEYGPFGSLTVGSPAAAAAFPYRFSTKPQDPSTGLYHYGYRDLNILTGRWTAKDPIGESGGVNLYGFVGNDAVGRFDVLGWGELWTISGINSTNPDKKPIGPLVNYVGKYLKHNGIEVTKGRSMHSNAGTVGPKNWNYICPGGKPFVLHPWSKDVLDKEANEYAEKCCKKRDFCGKKICVVMIAPKTSTLPSASRCCDLTINTWWDPYDPCPNQGPGGTPESQEHWSKYGVAYPVASAGNKGNHEFKPFMQSNPMYVPNWKPDPADILSLWPKSGKSAPNPMDVIRQFKSSCDITIVCHSQGCNTAMAILNRACTK